MTENTSASKSGEQKTHPLQFKWTLWHDIVNRSSYGANLREVASFDTVEDFWAVFNNLMEPSRLPRNNTYNLFKYGIEPKWEDKQNTNGGEWRLPLPNSYKDQLDKYWLNTLLTVLGEGFGPEESDDISGIVLNIKSGKDRLAIWTKSALSADLQMRIGQRWKKTVSITHEIEYISFKDAMGGARRGSSRYRIE